MKTAIVIAILGIFATLGIAASTSLNGRINRVEDKAERRLERIETKIDRQAEVQASQGREIGEIKSALERIEEKLD